MSKVSPSKQQMHKPLCPCGRKLLLVKEAPRGCPDPGRGRAPKPKKGRWGVMGSWWDSSGGTGGCRAQPVWTSSTVT